MQRILLCLFLFISPPIVAEECLESSEEESKWDVSSDQYHTQEISIDTTETTWSNVTVSHDGNTLVFDMLGDIYSVPISGGEATALTNGIEWNYQPRFSPDGSRIAFVSDRAGGDNLWIMNADGSDAQAVTDEAEHLVHNPSWSPDGNFLVGRKGFYSTRSIPAGEIWMFHHGGGNGVNLVKRPNDETDQKSRAEPAFSPDGKYVYYSADITAGKIWQYNKNSVGSVFAIKTTGTGYRRNQHCGQRPWWRHSPYPVTGWQIHRLYETTPGPGDTNHGQGSGIRSGKTAV